MKKKFSTWVFALSLLQSAPLRAGDLASLQKLLDSGAPVNARDSLGATALHDAVWAERADMVRLLIARGADVQAKHSDGGSTPLDYAAVHGNREIAGLLLKAGAQVDDAALNLAAAHDDTAMLRLFLDARAEPGFETAAVAAQHGAFGALSLLLDGSPSQSQRLLPEALRKGDAQVVNVLAAHGADVNQRDRFGATPFHTAAAVGDLALIRVLLERHADVNARTPDSGTTPLYEAASLGRTEAVAMLVAGGADANLPDSSGQTPVHSAGVNGFDETVRWLVSHGARSGR